MTKGEEEVGERAVEKGGQRMLRPNGTAKGCLEHREIDWAELCITGCCEIKTPATSSG